MWKGNSSKEEKRRKARIPRPWVDCRIHVEEEGEEGGGEEEEEEEEEDEEEKEDAYVSERSFSSIRISPPTSPRVEEAEEAGAVGFRWLRLREKNVAHFRRCHHLLQVAEEHLKCTKEEAREEQSNYFNKENPSY
jgi:hypothetical protein